MHLQCAVDLEDATGQLPRSDGVRFPLEISEQSTRLFGAEQEVVDAYELLPLCALVRRRLTAAAIAVVRLVDGEELTTPVVEGCALGRQLLW